MQCPKCHYERTAIDIARNDECPKCGIIYAKYNPIAEAHKQALRVRLRSQQASNLTAAVAPSVVTVEAVASAPPSEPAQDETKHIPGNLAVCKHCEELGQVALKLPGNGWVEALLYLFYVLPGIIYSVWRRKGKKQVCGSCGSDQLVAAKTRTGQQIIVAQIPKFKIVKPDIEVRYRKPTYGKTTAVLLCFFAVVLLIQGVMVIAMGINSNGLEFISLVLSSLCSVGAYRIFKQKPVPISVQGLPLVGW